MSGRALFAQNLKNIRFYPKRYYSPTKLPHLPTSSVSKYPDNRTERDLKTLYAELEDNSHLFYNHVITSKGYFPSSKTVHSLMLASKCDKLQSKQNSANKKPTLSSCLTCPKKEISEILKRKLVVAIRCENYLDVIDKFRRDKRQIVYVDDGFLHFCWDSSENERQSIPQMMIAASEGGLIGGAARLLKREANGKVEWSCERFNRYLQNVLFPIIPKSAVIVTDNRSFFPRPYQKDMNKASKAIHDFTASIVTKETDNEKLTTLRQEMRGLSTFERLDRTFLRLPPYHLYLSPIGATFRDINEALASQCVYEHSPTHERQNFFKTQFDVINTQKWDEFMRIISQKEKDMRKLAKC